MRREASSRYTVSNGLKARTGAKETDSTALAVTTQDNAMKKTFTKMFAISLDFDFFKHPVYIRMALKKI